MTDSLDDATIVSEIAIDPRSDATTNGDLMRGIEQLLGEFLAQAPAHERTQLIECLLRPVGPLALITIADGAFAHLLYRLQRDAAPISPDDTTSITSDHVLDLARYVKQCSPDVLLRVGSQVANRMSQRTSMSDSEPAIFAIA